MESWCALIKITQADQRMSRQRMISGATLIVRNDTTIDGVMQMLQTMAPPYVRYLRGEQPWLETVVLWPFGKERRQAARRAKAERIAREALNCPDIHALVLRQAQDIPADAFQIAELLIRVITSHVLAKRVALPLDPNGIKLRESA
jgi:hypothetical protein